MTDEHNPVALLIYKIQNAWLQQISPNENIQLIRWLINPQDISFYNGFIQLENTEHGRVPEGIHVLFTPYTVLDVHSRALMTDFLQSLEDDKKTRKKLAAENIVLDFDSAAFLKLSKEEKSGHDEDFMKMLVAYKNAFPKNTRLVLALVPDTVRDYRWYKKWFKNILKIGLPQDICLLTFDDENKNYLSDLPIAFPDQVVDFKVPINLNEALRKAATAGSGGGGSNNIQATFNDYFFKMGDAVAENSQAKLDKLAEQAINFCKQQANIGLLATVYIMHAGMLVGFKDYTLIENQLNKGLVITQKGIEQKDETCNSLLVQYYAYLSMLFFYKKEYYKSVEYLMMQADAAIERKLFPVAITAYRQAERLADEHGYNKQRLLVLEKAYTVSKQMDRSEIPFSEFIELGYMWYYHFCTQRGQQVAAKEIDEYMTGLYGTGWEQKAKESRYRLKKSKEAAAVFKK